MSDPFSVAGSAVGIVSLGLAVCQGIIGYYNAYKGQEDEVDEMLEKTSRLASILKLLKPRLDRHKAAHPHTINQLMSCLASFDQAVAKLNTLIKKCEHATASHTSRQKLRTFGKKALYPFRQETLHIWRESVTACQRNVDIAIGVLQLEMHDTTNTAVTAVAVGHETIVQNQQLLLSRFEEIHRSIVTSRALFSAPAKAVTIPSKFLIPDRHLVSQSARDVSPPAAIAPYRKDLSFCPCTPYARVRQSRLRFRSITLLWGSKEIFHHRDHCPYAIPSIRYYQYGTEVSVGVLVRKWTIQAILNFNQALGIFSITPTLTFRAVVPDDSPAFTLLSSAWHSKSLLETESAFQSLARTFQNGIAAPTDMNESGQTLLHKAAQNLKNVPEIVVGKELIEICMKYQKIVIGLLSIGVPADPIDNNGIHITDVYYSLTLVDRFHESLPPEYTKYLFQFGDQVVERLEFDFSNLSKMVLDTVKRDYKTSDGEKIRLVSFIAEFQRRSPHFTEGMECGKLSHAILRRSLEDVKKMVKSSPGALYERNVLQQSPLHLAAGWPAAMEVLLSSPTASEIVSVGDAVGLLPLEYACWYPCLSSVQLLLKANSRITKSISSFAYKHAENSILREIAFGVAARRDRLQKWAQDVLPPETYRDLLLPPNGHLDNKQAQNLEREVHAHAGFVPQSLRTTCSFPDEEDDVADARHTSLPAATILYEAGFRFNLEKLCQQLGVLSVDESEAGLDIEPAKMLDTLDWALQTQFFVQPLYRMAALLESTFGLAYGTNVCSAHSVHPEALAALWFGFFERHLSGKDCACSPLGSFSDIFLEDQSPEADPRALEHYPGYRQVLVPRAISAFVFDELGLTHSASCYWTHWANRDVISDMQVREQHLWMKFKELFGRLIEEYERLDVSLGEFLSESGHACRVVKEAMDGDYLAEGSAVPAN